MMASRLITVAAVVFALGCDDDATPRFDGSVPDAGDPLACAFVETDGGPFVPVEVDGAVEGGMPDAAANDGAVDGGAPDAGPPDAGPPAMDGGASDSGPLDGALPGMDGGTDAGGVDGGTAGDAGAGRVTEGLVVLYAFEEGAGATVHDVSGVDPPIDLVAADPANLAWGPGALRIVESTVIASAEPATKVIDACRTSGELSLEAWLRPALLDQSGPSRILTLSVDTGSRNFTLAQDLSRILVRLRTGVTDDNGTPSVRTTTCSFVPELTHVVYTYETTGVATIYIDGQIRGGGSVGSDLGDWDDEYRLALANELTGDRTWLGDLHLVAVYCRALAAAEVRRNLEAGLR